MQGRLGRDATLLQERALTVVFSSSKTAGITYETVEVKQVDMGCGKGSSWQYHGLWYHIILCKYLYYINII